MIWSILIDFGVPRGLLDINFQFPLLASNQVGSGILVALVQCASSREQGPDALAPAVGQDLEPQLPQCLCVCLFVCLSPKKSRQAFFASRGADMHALLGLIRAYPCSE